MTEIKKEPYKRNWLKECFDIYEGKLNTQPKKQHINAIVQSMLELGKRTEKLNELLKQAYSKSIIKRVDIMEPGLISGDKK